jgi:hypothetical protein
MKRPRLDSRAVLMKLHTLVELKNNNKNSFGQPVILKAICYESIPGP